MTRLEIAAWTLCRAGAPVEVTVFIVWLLSLGATSRIEEAGAELVRRLQSENFVAELHTFRLRARRLRRRWSDAV